MWKITASKGTNKPREKVTEGSHEAMLIRVIDLGTQKPHPKSPYQDPSRNIELVYEILDQTIEINWEKKPMRVYEKVSPYISTNKTTNYHKKLNLLSGKSLTTEEAEEFDFEPLLWSIYSIQIVHNGEWENITGVTKVSKKVADLYKDYESPNESFFFSLEDYNDAIYQKLTDKKRDIISMSPEYQKAVGISIEWDKEFSDSDDLANLPF